MCVSNKEEPLVSIIIPVYNVDKYIAETLEAVIRQSYQNWECICVDDFSVDNSCTILNDYSKRDSRIKVYRMSFNGGAALARNKGIEHAKGIFIAFLDSDDIWENDKLSIQINYMIQHDINFCCTAYGKINEYSEQLNKVCKVKKKYKYKDILKKCPGNSTVIYNCQKLGKIYGPDIRRRNDFALWLKVIKVSDELHGIDNVLSFHRIRGGSISISKSKLIKYQWKVYFEIERLGLVRSAYLIAYKIMQTFFNKNG